MNLLKRRWLKWSLRRSHNGSAGAMDRLYCLKDPWGLDAPPERFRFEETSRLIREKIGPQFESILEVGCGEGLQTEYLAPLAKRIVGVDPSSRAVKRARAREIANATFAVGELTTFKPLAGERFDLARACEVVYYLADFEAACDCLSQLGRNCVVTYYEGRAGQLDGIFAGRAAQLETIRGFSAERRFVWWRSKANVLVQGGGDSVGI